MREVVKSGVRDRKLVWAMCMERLLDVKENRSRRSAAVATKVTGTKGLKKQGRGWGIKDKKKEMRIVEPKVVEDWF
jgi:hypothetical protein